MLGSQSLPLQLSPSQRCAGVVLPHTLPTGESLHRVIEVFERETWLSRKIDEQVKRGDVPYQLRVDKPNEEVKATEQRPKQKQQAKHRKKKKN